MKTQPILTLLFLLFFTHLSHAQLTLIHAHMGECTGEASLAHQPNGVSWNWKKDSVLQQYGGYYLRYLCPGNYSVELMQDDSLTIYFFSIDSVENAYPCGSYYFGWTSYQSTVNDCDAIANINANGNTYDQMVCIPAIDSTQISFTNGAVYLTGLCDENYEITFSDTVSGCSSTTHINIFNLTHCNGFALTMHNVQPNTTINTCDGSLYAELTGGNQPYTYEWEGMNNYTDTITDLCFGFYSIIVTDSLGCTTQQTFYSLTDSLLNPVYEYLAFAFPFPATADSLCDGGVEVIVGGGVMPYTFQHSNGDSLQIIQNLCPGIYSVLVIDANNDTLHLDYVISASGFAAEQLYVSESSLGIEKLKNKEAIISQLAGTNHVLIWLPSEQHSEIKLYDLTGKVIAHQKIFGDHFELELPAIASGNYILELQYTGSTIRKLIQH